MSKYSDSQILRKVGVELFCLIDTKMCNNGVKVYQIHPIDDPGNMLRMVVRHHKVYVIEPGGHFANNDFCHLVRIVRRY